MSAASVRTPGLVSLVMAKRRQLAQSRDAWKWALANLAGAFLTMADTYLHFMLGSHSGWRPSLTGLESVMAVVFFANAVIDVARHFFPYFNLKSLLGGIFGGMDHLQPSYLAEDVVLTQKQMTLLGVNKGDPGFKLLEEKKAKADSSKHPFGFGPPIEGSFILSPGVQTAANSPNSRMSSMDSSSWHYYNPGSPNTSGQYPGLDGNKTKDQTPNNQPQSYTPKFNSSLTEVNDERSLRQYLKEYNEWEKSSLNNSNMAVADQSSLNNTSWGSPLSGGAAQQMQPQQQQLKDYSPFLKNISYQVSSPMPVGHDSPLADRKSQGSGSHIHPDQKSPSLPNFDCGNADVWQRLGVGPIKVVDYLENLRMWISQTVLKRVVEEIDSTNARLVQFGMPDERIGKIELEKLKRVAMQPHILQQVPSLEALIPFLDFHPNHKYLIQRFRELSDGGAMSDYKWNSGGKFNGAEWNGDKLPTDAEVVMNCVSAYLDTRLVPRSRAVLSLVTASSGGGAAATAKPFTGTHYQTMAQYLAEEAKAAAAATAVTDGAHIKKKQEDQNSSNFLAKLSPDVRALIALSPKKSSADGDKEGGQGGDKDKGDAQDSSGTGMAGSSGRGCVIVQRSARPPRYELHLKPLEQMTASSKKNQLEKICVGPGHNNLFHTLLLFLHHVKNSESGMLGRINFGKSGVNMLCIIEADN